jgi:hypothetical protein
MRRTLQLAGVVSGVLLGGRAMAGETAGPPAAPLSEPAPSAPASPGGATYYIYIESEGRFPHCDSVLDAARASPRPERKAALAAAHEVERQGLCWRSWTRPSRTLEMEPPTQREPGLIGFVIMDRGLEGPTDWARVPLAGAQLSPWYSEGPVHTADMTPLQMGFIRGPYEKLEPW